MNEVIHEKTDPWVHRSSEMQCRSCMWYVIKERNKKSERTVGRCRRHSPIVFSSDWCGDHKLDENKL